jgi:hypothetical protein
MLRHSKAVLCMHACGTKFAFMLLDRWTNKYDLRSHLCSHMLRLMQQCVIFMPPADSCAASHALRAYPQVTALSELVIEVWGLPSQSMFSSRRGSSSKAGPHGKADGDGAAGGKQEGSGSSSRKAADSAAAGSSSSYGSQAGSLPSGSIFLGAVNVGS